MTKHSGQRSSVTEETHGFKLSPGKRTTGLTLQGAVRVAPQYLTERFGPPSGATGDGKVSGKYVFEDDRGNTLAIYDWKLTALYDGCPAANLPTVQAFWSSRESAEFSLAASGSANLIAFARWVGATSIGLERALQWTEATGPPC